MIVPPFASKSKVVKKAAASFGVTQLISPAGLFIICGIITYPHSISDPHATMCLALALLGSASHAVPFWLGEFRTKKLSSTLRLGFCLVQSLVLVIAYLVRQKSLNEGSDYESGDDLGHDVTILITFMLITCFWDIVLFVSCFGRGEPGWVLRTINVIAALLLNITYIATVINLKFKLKACNMNTGSDNQWKYGQYLALFVLAAPIYATLEAFLGMSNLCSQIRNLTEHNPDGLEESRRTNPDDEEQPASDIELRNLDRSNKTDRSSPSPQQQDDQL